MAGRAGPRVIVASDAFKGSLTSMEVADAVRLGLLDVAPSAVVTVVPVADGGEGTVAAALAAGWSPVAAPVHGPTGQPVIATLAVRPPPTPEPPEPPQKVQVKGIDTAEPTLSSADTAEPSLSSVESRDEVLAGAPHDRAVLVEMADACGLMRLPGGVPAALAASSRGLGEAIRAALDLEPAAVVVGVGGSASTDGGAGMLVALGARLLDEAGRELPDGGAALAGLHRLDLSGLDPRLAGTRLLLAADVDSPLLGPAGAAAVFAPQKGATASEVAVLEAALTHWADVVAAALPLPPAGTRSTNRSKLHHPDHTPPGTTSTNRSKLHHPEHHPPGTRSPYWSILSQQPGSGAAGGVGFALLAVLGAEHRSGVDLVLELVGLDAALVGDLASNDRPADLVVTGEGALDTQTLAGKAVAGVAQRAGAHGIPTVAVCGHLALDAGGLDEVGLRAAYPLSDLEPDRDRSVRDAAELVRRTARRIAQEWLSG